MEKSTWSWDPHLGSERGKKFSLGLVTYKIWWLHVIHVGTKGVTKMCESGPAPLSCRGMWSTLKTCLFCIWVAMPNLVAVRQTTWAYISTVVPNSSFLAPACCPSVGSGDYKCNWLQQSTEKFRGDQYVGQGLAVGTLSRKMQYTASRSLFGALSVLCWSFQPTLILSCNAKILVLS